MKYNIADFGAIPGGEADCTRAIQAALDACFKGGGGVVEIPEGVWLSGDIRVRSNTELRLKSGATLLGSRNPEDYNHLFRDEIEPIERNKVNLGSWGRIRDSRGKSSMYSFMVSNPLSRWGRGLIRAMKAENIRIVGELGSKIDGADPYDPLGEEYYRGPHGISIHNCKNVTLEGYTLERTGNWAHNIQNTSDLTVRNITVNGGHDGFDIFGCDRVEVEHCGFYTGDDCIAGYNNRYVHISDCEINSACSAFRFAGTDVLVENCRIFGPGRYIFRGSLTLDEKKSGAPSVMKEDGTHRRNMLSFVTYYCCEDAPIWRVPGNIVFRDCSVKDADRFMHYNFSGAEYWQSIMPLHDITFENVTAENTKLPLNLCGDDIMKVRLTMKNVKLTFREPIAEFIRAANYEKIELSGVEVEPNVVKSYGGEGELASDSGTKLVKSNEKFSAQGI